MNPNTLATLVLIAVLLGSVVAWAITRRLTARHPTPSGGLLVVVSWTLLVAGIPYAIFALGATSARGHGSLSVAGGIIIGSLPLLLIGAPVVALIYTFRHFARHVRDNFDETRSVLSESEAESGDSHGSGPQDC